MSGQPIALNKSGVSNGNWAGTNDAAHVIQTIAGAAQARNREIAALSTVKVITWPSPGVTEVTITVAQEAAGTAELRASVAVCFDAPSDLVATNWLTHADSLTTDSNMFVVMSGDTRTFYFTSGITRLDAKRLYGSEALAVVVEAA